MSNRRKKSRKARAQHYHSSLRAFQRFGLSYDEKMKDDLIGAINGSLKSNAIVKYTFKQSCRVTEFVVERHGQFVRFVYDKQTKEIASFLPIEDDYLNFLKKQQR